jgi:hypothetical protein
MRGGSAEWPSVQIADDALRTAVLTLACGSSTTLRASSCRNTGNTEMTPRSFRYLHTCIADRLLRTKVGKTFTLGQIHEAMTYETEPGAKAVLLPQSSYTDFPEAIPRKIVDE